MSSAPDSKDRLSQAIGTTPFNSNGTIGRVLTFEVPKGPMVRRRPGICGERYEQAKADFESKPWYVRWTAGHGRPVGAQPTDELMYAKQFREECEKWPDEISQSIIDDKRQQLTDHVTGISKAEVLDCRFEECTMHAMRLFRVDLSGTTFSSCRFVDVDFSEAVALRVRFENCSFSDTRLTRDFLFTGTADFKFSAEGRLEK